MRRTEDNQTGSRGRRLHAIEDAPVFPDRDRRQPRSRDPYPLLEQPDRTLRDYVEILVKRFWVVLILFIVTLGIAAVYTFTRDAVYRSEATIRIGKQTGDSISKLGEDLDDALNPNAKEVFETHAEMLRSRSLALELIRRMKLNELESFEPISTRGFVGEALGLFRSVLGFIKGETEAPPSDYVKEDALVRNVQSRVQASRIGKSRLIQVSMESRDPELAQQLLKTYLTIYVERELNTKKQVDVKALEWLQYELQAVGDKLLHSLQTMVKFTNEHGIVSLDDDSNYHLKFFEKAAEGLVSAREQRVQIEATIKESNTPSDALMLTDSQRSDLSRLEEKLSNLEAEYAEYKDIYSEDFPKMVRLKSKIQALTEKISSIEKRALSSALESVKEAERVHEVTFEEAKQKAMDVNSLGVRYAVLKKEVETNEEIYRILLRKSKEMELNAKIVENDVHIVDQPRRPLTPIRPRKMLTLVIGTFFGLSLGIAVALVLEQLDDKIRTSEDIEQKLGLPNLGSVPVATRAAMNGQRELKSQPLEFLPHFNPRAAPAEAISNIKTSLFLSSAHGRPQTLLISSALPGEGKTFVSVSIGASLAAPNRKVLLIDADMRRPRLGKVFGRTNQKPGLSELLTVGDTKLKHVIRTSAVPNLYYMPAGRLPPNPVRLLESDRMAYFLSKIKGAFHLVIFDSPPVLGFSDSQIIAAMTDETMLVVKAGHTPLEMILRAHELLERGGQEVLGVVLNMTSTAGFSYYRGYRYYRYYGYGKYYYAKNDDEN